MLSSQRKSRANATLADFRRPGLLRFNARHGFRSRLWQPPDPLLTSLLDIGEASAIELAKHHQPCVLLMDEARGRKVARDIYGLRVAGTGRVLAEAKRAGLIVQVKPLVEGIRANGYWLSDKTYAEILRQAEE